MQYFFHLEGKDDAELDESALDEVLNGSLRRQHQELWETIGETESLDSNFLQFFESDAQNTILTLLGEKRGSMPAEGGRTPDLSPLSDYAEAVRSMGGDVYVQDNMIVRNNMEVHQPRVFVTKDRSFRDREIPVFNDDDIEIGKSLGYPEEEVIAFSENEFWPEGIEFNQDQEMVPASYESGSDYLFRPDMLARERDIAGYEQELDLIRYSIRDNQEGLNKAVETGKRYKEALETVENQYDVNIL